jgi:MFS transporter, SHS family, lactate transporter
LRTNANTIKRGCVYAYVILLTFLGPERRGRAFDIAHDSDLAEATGHHELGGTGAPHSDEDEKSHAQKEREVV